MTTPAPLPLPPAKPPYKDKPWLISVAMTIVSAIAAYHGVPLGTPGLESVVDLVVQGVLGLSGLAAAVRTVILREKAKETQP